MASSTVNTMSESSASYEKPTLITLIYDHKQISKLNKLIEPAITSARNFMFRPALIASMAVRSKYKHITLENGQKLFPDKMFNRKIYTDHHNNNLLGVLSHYDTIDGWTYSYAESEINSDHADEISHTDLKDRNKKNKAKKQLELDLEREKEKEKEKENGKKLKTIKLDQDMLSIYLCLNPRDQLKSLTTLYCKTIMEYVQNNLPIDLDIIPDKLDEVIENANSVSDFNEIFHKLMASFINLSTTEDTKEDSKDENTNTKEDNMIANTKHTTFKSKFYTTLHESPKFKYFKEFDVDTLDVEILKQFFSISEKILANIYFAIRTRGGYHFIYKADDFPEEATKAVLDMKFESVDKKNNKIYKQYVEIKTDVCIPVPGTMQMGFKVRFVELDELKQI